MIKVLVTNDDGIDALGLRVLVEALAEHADVYVVAPKEEQSAKSHSITFLREVSAEEREVKGAVEAWALDGTPVDCVMWGLGRLKDEGIRPDFLFSGVNMGYNNGLAAYYSGTVAGAREGAINEIRSIALSVGSHHASFFDYLMGLLPRLMEMSRRISPRTILSVNAPDLPSWDIKGVRVVEAAPRGYGVHFGFSKAESGDYKMHSSPDFKDDKMRYDIDWNEAGYVAVSPLPTSLADPVALMRLKGQTAQTECVTVIVDAQKKTLKRVKKPDVFEENITKLAHAVSRMGMPLLFTQSGGSGDLLPELGSYMDEAETVIHVHPDAWSSPDMEKLLSSVDAERVLIAGAASNIELLQTALGFIERGYEVTVIEDCCAASKKSDHKVAMKDLEDAGCRMSTLGTEVMKLAASCSKQVLDSVKNILFA
jgi:5'-nucleotidase